MRRNYHRKLWGEIITGNYGEKREREKKNEREKKDREA